MNAKANRIVIAIYHRTRSWDSDQDRKQFLAHMPRFRPADSGANPVAQNSELGVLWRRVDGRVRRAVGLSVTNSSSGGRPMRRMQTGVHFAHECRGCRGRRDADHCGDRSIDIGAVLVSARIHRREPGRINAALSALAWPPQKEEAIVLVGCEDRGGKSGALQRCSLRPALWRCRGARAKWIRANLRLRRRRQRRTRSKRSLS